MIYGERVRQVREMHRLTQAALAEQVPALTQSRLSRIESDRATPDDEATALLALASGVTTDFFGRPPVPGLLAHSPHLRARSRLTEAAKSAAMQWARLVDECYQRLRQQATALPVRITPMPGAGPTEAARAVRRQLGFSADEPLAYLVLAVERLGVTVLGLPCVIDGLDAFCAWRGDEPVIALLGGAPGDRHRFNVAHEFGHLVLHQPRQTGRTTEAEADAFAAELLTPLDAIARAMPRRPTLSSLAMLKTTWGVSIKSLVRRARELGLVDHEGAISLYKQISARGWNRNEPGHVAHEKPRAFRKLAEIAYGAGPNVPRFAADAGWSEELAHAVLAQHATPDELPHRVRGHETGNVVALRAPAARPLRW
ncbi:MAG TPA: XRE family transcriptional regulator [Mycobacteriales bacterium]|nr:XRE family transcriptional regulator [Mycobacteriales bacterium]